MSVDLFHVSARRNLRDSTHEVEVNTDDAQNSQSSK